MRRTLGAASPLACLVALVLFGGPYGPEVVLVAAALSAAPLGAFTGMLPAPGASAIGLAAGFALVALTAIGFGGGPWALAALLGLAAFGRAVAAAAGRTWVQRGAAALALLALGAGLHGLAVRGGLGRAPWPPLVAARALDLSPVTLVAECAGLDWLRRPAIYGPAGADSIGPTERAPYDPMLAGGLALVLGCALWGAAASVARRSEDNPWPRASSSAPSPRS